MALYGGDHEKICVHLGPVDVISRVADKLRQEGALSTAAAPAERGEVVGSAIEIHDLICKDIMGWPAEVILFIQVVKNPSGA